MSNLKKYKDKRGQSFPHLYQDLDLKEFWVLVRVGDKIKKRNLKTTEYVRALAMLPEALASLGDEKSEAKAEKVRDVKLLSDYWADLVKEKMADDTAEPTLKRMDTVWRHHIEPFLGNWRPDQVKPDMIPDFVAWHRTEKPGTQLINVYKYMGNLFHYMVRIGALQMLQVPVIKVPKAEKKHHDKKKGRIITDEERAALLNHGEARIRLVLGVLDALGMRKMEFVSIEKERILKEADRYFLELTEDDTKTGLPRILPVPRNLEAILLEQMRESGDSKFLFPRKDGLSYLPSQMIDREWKQVKTAAKIKGRLRMHDWRHSRATLMAKMNINPVVACTLLGMTIGIYQKRYLKLTGRDLVATVDQMSQLEGK